MFLLSVAILAQGARGSSRPGLCTRPASLVSPQRPSTRRALPPLAITLQAAAAGRTLQAALAAPGTAPPTVRADTAAGGWWRKRHKAPPTSAAPPREQGAGHGTSYARMGMHDMPHLEQRGPLDLQRAQVHAEQAGARAKPPAQQARWWRGLLLSALATATLAMLPVRLQEPPRPLPLPPLRGERGAAADGGQTAWQATAGHARPWWCSHAALVPRWRSHEAAALGAHSRRRRRLCSLALRFPR